MVGRLVFGHSASILPRTPIDFDRYLHRARHAVENPFAWLKQFRNLATRYDKTARNDSAMVAIACIVVWLKV
jgi:transposase